MKTFLTCLVLILIPIFAFSTPESADALATNGGLDSLERLIHDNLAFTRLDPASAMWNFLHGPVLPVLELILMLFAVVLILRSTVAKSAIPFVIAVVLQVYQTLMLGNDALWWCLPEYQGLGGSFVGFIPLALYLALEFSYIILVWTFSSGNVRIWPVFLAAILQYFAASISYATIGNAWIGIIAIYAIPLLMNGAKGGSSGVNDTLLLIAGMAGFMVTLSAAFFASMMIVTEIVLVCPAAGFGLAFLFKRLQNRDYTARQLPNGKWAVYNDVFDTHAQALRHIERMREQDKARDEQGRRRNNW
jgi:membrane protein